MRALHRFRGVIDGLPEAKYLVLAERSCAVGDLRKGVESLYRAWQKLRKQSAWKLVRGALTVLEVTYNREKKTWHPHLNVVLDGPYIPFEQLRDSWIHATGGKGRTAFIRKANGGTAKELIKYITKVVEFIDCPEAVEDFLGGTRGRRFIRTYGTLYGIGVEEAEEEGGEGHRCCPECGSKDIDIYAMCLYEHQVRFDGRGVLRVPLGVQQARAWAQGARRKQSCGP